MSVPWEQPEIQQVNSEQHISVILEIRKTSRISCVSQNADLGVPTPILGPCAGDVSRGRVSSRLRHFDKAHPGPAFLLSMRELLVAGAMLPSCLSSQLFPAPWSECSCHP